EDIGLRVDEGYKTLAPRNLALFGQPQWSEADEYHGWFDGSPLTQSALLLTFRVAGAELLTARVTAMVYFLALALMILWGTRQLLSPLQWTALAVLLALEPYLFFFSRVALFEVALAAFLVPALLLVRHFGERRLGWSLLAVLALMGAAF